MSGSSIRIAVSIVFTALSMNTTQAQEAEPVALITGLTGQVFVAKAPSETFEQAGWGLQLFDGDQIRTLQDAEVSIHFSDSNVVILGANSSMTIAPVRQVLDTASNSEESVDRGALSNLTNLAFYRAGRGEISLLGGYRTARTDRWIDPFEPRNTIIRDQRPVFSWRAGTKFERFSVKLFDDSGQIWKGETTGTDLAYPESAVSLDPNTEYYWQVEGEEFLEVVASPAVGFQILSEEASGVISKGKELIASQFRDDLDESRYLMILGAFYEKEGLLSEAIATFGKVAELHPEAPLPQEILAVLYFDVGLRQEAVKAKERADRLKEGI